MSEAPAPLAPLTPDTRLLIDGELTAASGGRVFENVNPATEEVLGSCSDAGEAEMERAIAGAQTSTHLVREVRVARRIHEIHKVLTDKHRRRHRFDRNAPLALDVQRVQRRLASSLRPCYVAVLFEEALRQRGLAVVDVGDNAEGDRFLHRQRCQPSLV